MINEFIKKLSANLVKIPTISKKNAENIAFFLLEHREIGENISNSLQNALTSIKICSLCNNFSEKEQCKICLERKDSKTICVIHGINDLVNIERTKAYNGKYHILKGKLDPLQGIDKKDLDIDRIKKRIEKENIEEVILALDKDPEGELTSSVILKDLQNVVKISKILSGIPSGSKVSSSDISSLEKSIKNREDLI